MILLFLTYHQITVNPFPDLTSLFYNYVGKKFIRDPLLIKYLQNFIANLNRTTWKERASHFKSWETSQNITKKKKKELPQISKLLLTQTLIAILHKIMIGVLAHDLGHSYLLTDLIKNLF